MSGTGSMDGRSAVRGSSAWCGRGRAARDWGVGTDSGWGAAVMSGRYEGTMSTEGSAAVDDEEEDDEEVAVEGIHIDEGVLSSVLRVLLLVAAPALRRLRRSPVVF